MTLSHHARMMQAHAKSLQNVADGKLPRGARRCDIETDIASDLLGQFYVYCNAAGLDFSYILKQAKHRAADWAPRGVDLQPSFPSGVIRPMPTFSPPGNEWEHHPCPGCDDPAGCGDRCGASVSPEGSFIRVGDLP